jgi:hypothetical protein
MWDTTGLVWVPFAASGGSTGATGGSSGGTSIFRYGAAGSFHNPTTYQSAIVRSTVKDNITVTRGTAISLFSDDGFPYTITIPSGDDIFHMTLVDRATSSLFNSVARFTFIWSDTDFEGNVDEETLVIPTIMLHQYGNGTTPDYSANTSQARSPNAGANVVSCYFADNRTLRVDIQLQDSGNTWYGIAFSF